ncbi:hypothetical protein CKAN_01950600 [Cinnamomum micranthum f. kanehirae]|uniref:Uncharacterized protein n=1 Tax=Cinnamomum micranthum f. kanehirae TaxID=337451 RepID=A0A3S3MV72_9MAGN|nr:hypothetical protein CKAN_01950600 [Cinnamomum micranthum f. kanehirae]
MASESWILEQAKEELQMLEAQHPERFDYLKLQLKSFISDLTCPNFSSSSHSLSQHLPPSCAALSTSAATQVSSNRRKRKGSEIRGMGVADSIPKRRIRRSDSSDARVDIVIERAEACLRKIRLVKESFMNGQNLL